MSKIEWVKNPDGSQGITLNPIKGMCPVACSYCYARRMYKRFKWKPELQFRPLTTEHALDNLKKPTGIFLCSTYEWLYYIDLAIDIINMIKQYPQHRFYLLTKLPHKLEIFSPFPDNCWVGVTITANGDMTNAYYGLNSIKCKCKFVSFEPLLGMVGVDDHVNMKDWVNWVIIGAQTPYSKKTAPRREWVVEITEAAKKANIPVFHKNNLPMDFFDADGFPMRQELPERISIHNNNC